MSLHQKGCASVSVIKDILSAWHWAAQTNREPHHPQTHRAGVLFWNTATLCAPQDLCQSNPTPRLMLKPRCPSHLSFSCCFHSSISKTIETLHFHCICMWRQHPDSDGLPVLMRGWHATEVTLGHALSSLVVRSLVLSFFPTVSFPQEVSAGLLFAAAPWEFGSAPVLQSRATGWLVTESCADAPGHCFTLRLCNWDWEREEVSAPCWPRRAKFCTWAEIDRSDFSRAFRKQHILV